MQGIVCSGIAYCVQGVVMKERGPVFVTAFNPLCMVIVAVLGTIILKEEINLGRYHSLSFFFFLFFPAISCGNESECKITKLLF